jgi:hypothetical protein
MITLVFIHDRFDSYPYLKFESKRKPRPNFVCGTQNPQRKILDFTRILFSENMSPKRLVVKWESFFV